MAIVKVASVGYNSDSLHIYTQASKQTNKCRRHPEEKKISEPMSPNFSFSYRKICQACDFYLKAKSPPAACIRKGIHTFSKKGGHRVFLHMNSTGPKQTLNCSFLN